MTPEDMYNKACELFEKKVYDDYKEKKETPFGSFTMPRQGAISLFTTAAEKGHPLAAYRLGLCYMSGYGVSRDNALAAKWLKTAVDLGITDAVSVLESLGIKYVAPQKQQVKPPPRSEHEPEIDDDEWLGDDPDEIVVDLFGTDKKKKKKDDTMLISVKSPDGEYFGKAKRNAKTPTPEGRGEFRYNNGDRYDGNYRGGRRDGNGIYYYADGTKERRTYKDGELIYPVVGQADDYCAEPNKTYDGDYISDEVDERILKGFAQKIALGDRLSPAEQADLGAELIRSGGPKCKKEGVKQLERAAYRGNTVAQCILGDAYSFGNMGLKKDYDKAFYWYDQAAQGGDAIAMFHLSVIYYTGRGVDIDREKALLWMERSAMSGDVDSMYKLGNMYRDGDGCDSDLIAAAYWYKEAMINGNAEAENAYNEIEDKL